MGFECAGPTYSPIGLRHLPGTDVKIGSLMLSFSR